MKSKLLHSISLLMATTLLSFCPKDEISHCYLSFTTATGLTATTPDRLPETAEKVRKLNTEKGEVDVTRIDGYRILYKNEKGAPFVNLKVELSAPNAYEQDKKNLLQNISYLNAHSQGMESSKPAQLKINGYTITGFSRADIEKGSILGTYILFAGNGVTVYFYFNNMKPEYRNFTSVPDYRQHRNRFLEEYTKHLTTCKVK